MEKAEGYWDLFLLIAHEFFHVWNVKRLRDPALGPFDYQRETLTRLLWFHEGFTSFMQYSIVLRAGAAPWAWAAKRLAASWTDNTIRAGLREQSLEEASFDAWIRHYKPTEFSSNSTVSYYDKGAMVAWMMDAELRLASGGARGLDHLFALAWQRFGDGPVTDGDLRALYRELTGQDPGPFWARYIQGREPSWTRGRSQGAYGLALQRQGALGNAGRPRCRRSRRASAGPGSTRASPSPARRPPWSTWRPARPRPGPGWATAWTILAVNGWRTAHGREVQRRLGDRAPGDRGGGRWRWTGAGSGPSA